MRPITDVFKKKMPIYVGGRLFPNERGEWEKEINKARGQSFWHGTARCCVNTTLLRVCVEEIQAEEYEQ